MIDRLCRALAPLFAGGILIVAGCQGAAPGEKGAPTTAPTAVPTTVPAGGPAGLASPAAKAASPAAASPVPTVAGAPSPAVKAASPATSPASKTAPSPAAKPSGPPAQLTVILDWYPWANHAGLYLAQRNGHFAAEGLDVKVEQPANPADVLKIVARNPNAIGFNYETDVLLARGEDIPVRSIAAIVQHPLNSVMTLKSSNLTRPRDLAGKTVGFPGIPSNEAYLKAMLEKDGLKFSDVRLVDVGFDLVPALIGRRVDAIIGAYWAHESILAELEGHPVNIMRVEEWGVPDYYELVFVASDDLINRNPDLATRFLRAVTKGYQDAMNNPAAGVDAVLAANPQARRELEIRSIQLLLPLWKEGDRPFGAQQNDRWTAYADWLKQAGLLPRGLDPLTAFTTRLLPAG